MDANFQNHAEETLIQLKDHRIGINQALEQLKEGQSNTTLYRVTAINVIGSVSINRMEPKEGVRKLCAVNL